MDALNTTLHEAGIRKAAVLVASLEASAADALLNRLAPKQAELVCQAAVALQRIGPGERQRVLDEFHRIRPMVPDKSPAGIELDALPASGVLPQSAADDAGPTSDASPFEFLRAAEHEELARLLQGERPQTVALVLSHLPAEQAAEFLARFAPAEQVEIVRRLADLENTDPQSLREVELALAARWSQQFDAEPPRTAGPHAVAKILAACDDQRRQRILDNFAAHDSPRQPVSDNLAVQDELLAEPFVRRQLDFDDLVQLDDAALAAVFRAAGPEVAQAALVGALPTMVERFLRQLPAEEAAIWRHKLDHPGPIRLADVEEARRQIAALAQRMSLADAA
jgi:flagellar motor switch protein FliG